MPDKETQTEEYPPKRINIEEKKHELTKRLWYDIAHQDSYYVYIDKQGNVYDEQGFYLETIKTDHI